MKYSSSYTTVFNLLLLLLSSVAAFAPPLSTTKSATSTQLYFNLPSQIANFGKTVKASHILIMQPDGLSGVLGAAGDEMGRGMPKDAAKAKLTELKEEIDNDPDKFAEAAKEYSCCPSCENGGYLGEFGPGKMIGPFDQVCFNDEVGVVHGPVWTPFGYHLILIKERS